MTNKKLIYKNILVFTILTIFFTYDPNFDIIISNFFYIFEEGFFWKHSYVAQGLSIIVPIGFKLLIVACILNLIYILIKTKNIKQVFLSGAFFILISASIGPGLIVNLVLRENFGRAMPIELKTFNGDKEFTRAFVISDQSQDNCSFSSDHAAMGFFFIIISYLFNGIRAEKAYKIILMFAILVGFCRVALGSSFASDVTTSAMIILSLNHIIYLLWQKQKEKLTK